MGGILRPFFAPPAKHLIRLARDRHYRAWRDLERRLGSVPRRTPRSVRALGLDLLVPDAASFLEVFREVFVERSMTFPSWGAPPRILDLGANLGLTVLYFLREHPDARITALEPDPDLFRVLERNVRQNGGEGVTLRRQAAWSQSGPLRFQPDGADGGRVRAGSAAPGAVEVEAVDVAALFDEGQYDVIKMDIEGAERVVLPALGDRLRSVRYLFMEVHAGRGDRAPLASLIAPIEAAGLEVEIQTVRCPAHPFHDSPSGEEFSLLLHVYGIRR